MKTKKIIIWGVVAVVLLAGAYWGIKKFILNPLKEENDKNKDEKDDKSKNKDTGSTQWRGDDFPLSKGSSGRRVKILQKMLGIKQDGYFGNDTEVALLMRTNKKDVTLADKKLFDKLFRMTYGKEIEELFK